MAHGQGEKEAQIYTGSTRRMYGQEVAESNRRESKVNMWEGV